MTKISVVIPCYNAEKWIRETLRSVVEQDILDLEVIVIDDGSTDHTASIVALEFSFVQLICTENHGASHARNVGMAVAKGDFIQFLDADDLLVSGKLRKQLELLEATGADIAYGDWQQIILDKAGGFRVDNVISRVMEQEADIALFTDFWCPLAAYLFRRRIIDKVTWNERLPIIQDARFVLDCALHGATFAYCNTVVAQYRVHATNSLSKRDPRAFDLDIFRNAEELHALWMASNTITEKRRNALIKVYGYVARAFFEQDKEIFDKAYQVICSLTSCYLPEKPRHLRIVSMIFGYKNAEYVALWYRKTKSLAKNSMKRTKQ